jgi:hypothetical protein
MKKHIAIVLSCLVAVHAARAADYDMQIQMLDAEIAKLTAEKQTKYADLEKCAKSVDGFKIAGISLLGLTAVGVGVNIYQANKISDLNNQIDAKKKEIEKKERDAKNARDKAEKERLEKEAAQEKKELEAQEAEKKKQEQAKADCEKTKQTDEECKYDADKKTWVAVKKESGGKIDVVESPAAPVSVEDEAGGTEDSGQDKSQTGFQCPATSNYPGASGKKLGAECSYPAGTYFGEARGGVSKGIIYRAASSCYCHPKECADTSNYEIKDGKCMKNTTTNPPAAKAKFESVEDYEYEPNIGEWKDAAQYAALTSSNMFKNPRWFKLKKVKHGTEIIPEIPGEAMCSGTGGTYAKSGNPSNDMAGGKITGSNCWCRVNYNGQFGPWVFRAQRGSAAGCSWSCADLCANGVRRDGEFLGAVFAPFEQ